MRDRPRITRGTFKRRVWLCGCYEEKTRSWSGLTTSTESCWCKDDLTCRR